MTEKCCLLFALSSKLHMTRHVIAAQLDLLQCRACQKVNANCSSLVY